jgi:hypothetical protein
MRSSRRSELAACGRNDRAPSRGGRPATATSSTIQIGTLVLDIYDQKGKQLVWTGSATKTIDPGAKPEKRQKNIAKAVTKLLKNYPPPTKK